MNRINKVSTMRLIYSIIIAIIFFACSTVMSVMSSLLVDQYICIVAINICLYLIFTLGIINKRLNNLLPEKKYISYGKIAFVLILDWVICIFSITLAPDFFTPIMLIPLLGATVLDENTNILISIYFAVLISICQNFNSYVILCYALLTVFGVALAPFLKSRQALEVFLSQLLVFSLNILCTVVFYYLNYLEITGLGLKYSIIDAIIVCLASAFFIPIFGHTIEQADMDIYDEILDPSYSLSQEIRKFSYIEFLHVSRVSRISGICAELIGANVKLAKCGGFYYRLGKLEGESIIDSSVKIANNHCFPEELILLLSEYGGVMALPSSRESAIVHMVDAIVTKIELFDQDLMTSDWNQNMIIYQTTNELSQSGVYDKSGLSMNQFLLIREQLTKEDILA